MKKKKKTNRNGRGTAVLVVIFAIALMTTLVVGILQLNTEELQMMQNQVAASQARFIAEAGLNRAMVELRNDRDWQSGYSNVNFQNIGTYSVTITKPCPDSSSDIRIDSSAKTKSEYISTVQADISIDSPAPHTIRVDALRINE